MTENDLRELCNDELGKPYIWGGEGPNGYDCSGFAQWVLAFIGLDPPGDQTADGLFRFYNRSSRGYPVDEATAEFGDLVFYGNHESVTHVAIAWGDRQMIEAGGGGRHTRTPEQAKAIGAKVRIVDINRRGDLVAIIRPYGVPWTTPLVAAAE